VRTVRKYEPFIEAHPEVEAWLKNRPQSTRKVFAARLEEFCNDMNISPEEWRALDKFEARDLAWKYIEPKIKEHPTVAQAYLTTLKSWYRNLNGERLPLDSGRGGKHYLHLAYKRHATEHIPNKPELYQIVDMVSSLRDKALLLFLFQSGVRVNVLQHLTLGDVFDQLDEDIITLKITADLDYKLRGRDIPFYYTFLNGEGAEALRRYCKLHHKDSTPDTPLFYTKGKKPISQAWVWRIVKMCVERAGFDPKTISTHTIRKAFRKIVRQTSIDDDDKEQVMGHVIKGSRQAYFDTHDIDLIKEAYLKCNFTREVPESNHVRMKSQIEQQQSQIMGLIGLVEELKRELATVRTEQKTIKAKLKVLKES
jgi:integrase